LHTIAVIDDDPSFLDALSIALRSKGKVYTTLDPRDCEAILQNPELKLLITDYQMRFRTGTQVLEIAKRVSPLLPVILVSAHADKDVAISAANLHVFSILEKPFDYKVLLDAVDRALADNLKKSQHVFHSAPLTLNSEALTVSVDCERVQLTAIEFKILELLIQNEGRCISRGSLIKAIWGNSRLSKNVFDTHLGNLRRKLSGFNLNLRTVRGKGYIYSSANDPRTPLHG
jgi:DNA-binding response OmpR family regulator